MQIASNEFDSAMKQSLRNRGYIKISIGVINSEAQANVELKDTETYFFSENAKPFDGYKVTQPYAMAEQDFSRVNGSMYFPPSEDSGLTYYNQGIVTSELLGSIRIEFNGLTGLDIKGLTIDFGVCYPTEFTVTNNYGTTTYENNSQYFSTDDSFDGTSYFVITPISMVDGLDRFRINEFTCGVANTFSNEKVIKCSSKEVVSSVSETVPSMDTTITLDNVDLYYSPDNPESVLSYMEVGQEVKVTYGYDITGNGNIEWLNETTTYLSSWSANDEEATFSSTDRFYQLDETYYGGLYRENGITLYDLALEVLNAAGITDSRDYYLDNYLKKITVYNPLPCSKYSECLQIIANAGRCVLYEDRSNRIHIKSSFVPDMSASSDDQADFSTIDNLLKSDAKRAYAVASNDFTPVNGTVYFISDNAGSYFTDTGYVSESISDSDGAFTSNPKITINLESGFTCYGLLINFRETAPTTFTVTTYLNNTQVSTMEVENNGNLEYNTKTMFAEFDKMVVEITKGYPLSRVFIDNILIGDVTNYVLTRDTELSEAPTGTRQQKIKNINVQRTTYSSGAEQKNLEQKEVAITELDENNQYTTQFTYASYGYSAYVSETDSDGNTVVSSTIKVTVVDSSSYYVKLKFTGITTEEKINLVIQGYEYATNESYLTTKYNERGQEVTWKNPLISTTEQAQDLSEWLSTYYLGDVEYDINWRGDPRSEANDLYYLELKDRDNALIRCSENTLEFDGAWSGSMKARKVVMQWQ